VEEVLPPQFTLRLRNQFGGWHQRRGASSLSIVLLCFTCLVPRCLEMLVT
jgi:hypothetical protein